MMNLLKEDIKQECSSSTGSTYVHTYMYTYMYVCVHTCVHTCSMYMYVVHVQVCTKWYIYHGVQVPVYTGNTFLF